jgi:hypothetical protein
MTQSNGEVKKQIIFIKIILIVVIAALFVSYFELELDLKLDLSCDKELPQNDCWHRFKEERCSIEKPNSELCKKLLECSRKESKKEDLVNVGKILMILMVSILLVAGLALLASFRYWKQGERMIKKIVRK